MCLNAANNVRISSAAMVERYPTPAEQWVAICKRFILEFFEL